MKIGVILTNEDLNGIDDFEVNTDSDLPRLIVGWDMAKEYGASALRNKIDIKTFWTFSPKEKRVKFEEDLKMFKDYCLEGIASKIKYYYIDPIQYKITTTEEYINKLEKLAGSIGYLFEEHKMLYIYNDGNIYGVDLGMLDFLGIDSDLVLDKAESVLDLTKENKYQKYTSKIGNKYVPYFIDCDGRENIIVSNLC